MLPGVDLLPGVRRTSGSRFTSGSETYFHESKTTSMNVGLEVNTRFHATFQLLPWKLSSASMKANVLSCMLESLAWKLCQLP